MAARRRRWACVAIATAVLVLATPEAFAAAPLAATAPVANPDTLVVPAGAASGTVDVLANDVYSAPATVDIAPTDGLAAPVHGSVALTTVDVDGGTRAAVTYTPEAGWAGQDTFAYAITDDSGRSARADVAITVTPVVVVPERPVSFVAPASIVVLHSAALTGAVQPVDGVVPVVEIQTQVAAGWVTYAAAPPAADGTFGLAWKASSPGTVTWRALATWPDGVQAASPSVVTTVVGSADPTVSGPLSRRHVPYSYRSGCPVSPILLRRLSINYWDYHGQVRRGAVIVHVSAVSAVRSVLSTAFAAKFPVKLMLPVDSYYRRGRATPAASDILSMDAGNTSAFNCRKVTGSRYRISQHSYGNAIDVNTYENPYGTSSRVYPAAAAYKYYVMRRYHLADRGVITPRSVVATAFARLHWLWGARWRNHDYQHFSANGG
jgi:hypothetical protein